MQPVQTSNDVLFVLLGAIMVLAMHAGFAFLGLGTVRRKNQVNALVKILSDFAVSTLAYFFIGYGIAYGVHFFSGAGALVEHTLARIARGLVERGVRRLIVAGGETSGACVQALEVAQMQIGPQIDPGVPWCHAQSPAAGAGGLHLSLKSGNFGSDDFFTKALTVLA